MIYNIKKNFIQEKNKTNLLILYIIFIFFFKPINRKKVEIQTTKKGVIKFVAKLINESLAKCDCVLI